MLRIRLREWQLVERRDSIPQKRKVCPNEHLPTYVYILGHYIATAVDLHPAMGNNCYIRRVQAKTDVCNSKGSCPTSNPPRPDLEVLAVAVPACIPFRGFSSASQKRLAQAGTATRTFCLVLLDIKCAAWLGYTKPKNGISCIDAMMRRSPRLAIHPEPPVSDDLPRLYVLGNCMELSRSELVKTACTQFCAIPRAISPSQCSVLGAGDGIVGAAEYHEVRIEKSQFG